MVTWVHVWTWEVRGMGDVVVSWWIASCLPLKMREVLGFWVLGAGPSTKMTGEKLGIWEKLGGSISVH